MATIDNVRRLLGRIPEVFADTITCRPLASSYADRGVRLGDSFTIVAQFTYTDGGVTFDEDVEQIRTAIVRSNDDQTRLQIGDQLEYDGQLWAVRNTQYPQGQYRYDVEAVGKLAVGPQDRGRG